jgi:hypothetical protein
VKRVLIETHRQVLSKVEDGVSSVAKDKFNASIRCNRGKTIANQVTNEYKRDEETHLTRKIFSQKRKSNKNEQKTTCFFTFPGCSCICRSIEEKCLPRGDTWDPKHK